MTEAIIPSAKRTVHVTRANIKRCVTCGFTCDRAVERVFFTRNKKSKDGMCYYCKKCCHDQNMQRQERMKEYNAAHREERKQYYYRNREKVIERQRTYKKSPQGKLQVKVHNHRRRARLAEAGGDITASDIELQIKAQTDKKGRLRCWWCGKVIKGGYDIDHVIPLVRGGSNSPENAVIAHPKCNGSKGAKLPGEYAGRLF